MLDKKSRVWYKGSMRMREGKERSVDANANVGWPFFVFWKTNWKTSSQAKDIGKGRGKEEEIFG